MLIKYWVCYTPLHPLLSYKQLPKLQTASPKHTVHTAEGCAQDSVLEPSTTDDWFGGYSPYSSSLKKTR